MVTIDCTEPQDLLRFWTEALRLEVGADYGDYIVLNDPEGDVRIGLQRVPEPRGEKNRLHLDLVTGDMPGEVARLVSLGATEISEHEMPGMGWTVLADPEGNQFCVGYQD